VVKFQVDGVTKATYTDSRAIMKDSTIIVGYNPYPPPGDGSIYDWKANYGDHLIRAWVDSLDKYVELRKDNNIGYFWKHFQPKVSVIINNNDKFTNHLTNNNLHIVMNESTTPLPDSAKLKHQGTWMKIGVFGSRDTAVSYSGNGIKYDSVKVWQSGDTANAGDTIIVDITAPRAQITSPAHGATVSGTINISGYAYDYGPTHFLVDTLRYFRNSIYHDTIHVSLVNIYGGVLGTWNTVPVPNGWTRDTLVVRDSAGNVSRDSISLNVYNKLQLRGGEGFATDFGIYPSSPMNVATDPGGNVYIAETQGSKIRKHSPRKDSLFAFSAKRGNDSTGTSWATSMTLRDSETIWIADGYNHCIKRFDRQGNLILRFGSFGTDTSRFKQPCGIALDNKGRLWVSDRLNNRIQVFDSTGHFLFQFGSQGRDSTQFDSPTGIAITRKDTLLGIVQDLVWISDTRNNRVQVYQIDTVSLAVRFFKTISQVDSSGLDTPLGICSDKWGDVFVADSRHNRIVELNPYGERILDFGGLGDSLCQFRTPVGVAASPGAHYLYVADMGNRRVQRFTVILEDSSGGGPQSGGIVQRIPLVYSLAQSHPNPTTGEALIEYGLPQESPVRLVVYNVAGQVVREYKPGKQEAGFYSYKWDGRSNLGHRVGAGVYFYRLRAGSWTKTRNMVVIR
jgi:sugar lactone lactonase YvrE